METTLAEISLPINEADNFHQDSFKAILLNSEEMVIHTDRLFSVRKIQIVGDEQPEVLDAFKGISLARILPHDAYKKLRELAVPEVSSFAIKRFDFPLPLEGNKCMYRLLLTSQANSSYTLCLQNRTQHLHLHNEAERRRRYREVHKLFIQALHSKNEEEDLLWAITENCVSLLSFEDCVIYLFDKETGTLRQCASYGNKSLTGRKILNPIELNLGEGIVGNVAKSLKSEIVNDVSSDTRYLVDDMARAAEIAVPMIYEDELIGVIDSEHSQKDFYNQELLELLENIATTSAIKIAAARARKRIVESEQKYRSIIENTNDLIMIIQPDGAIEYTSPSITKILGYEKTALNGHNLFDFLPESHHEDCKSDMNELLTGKKSVLCKEQPLRHEDGSWQALEVVARVMMEGTEVKIVCNSRDVTERKNAEDELRMARRALESTSDPITITNIRDPKRPIVYANPAFFELIGASPEEVIGCPSKLKGPKTEKRIIEDIEEALKNKQPFCGQLIAYRRDLSHFWTHLTINPVFDDTTGEVTHTVDVHKDISVDKEQQKQILKTILDTQEIERKRIAHDLHDGLGQTLSAANMFITAIETEVGERFTPDFQEFFGSASRLMKTAVEEARGISHNLMPNSLKQFGLHQSIVEAIEYNNSINDQLTIDLDSNIAKFRFDPKQEIMLYRVLQEIINNTLKHAKATKLAVKLRLRGEQLLIYTVDNGRGFNAGKMKGKGLGLEGLSNRVEMLEGTMAMDSAPGNGTKFKITLQIKPTPELVIGKAGLSNVI